MRLFLTDNWKSEGYSTLGDLTSLSHSDVTASYTFDFHGRLTEVSNSDGSSTRTFAYDSLGLSTGALYGTLGGWKEAYLNNESPWTGESRLKTDLSNGDFSVYVRTDIDKPIRFE